jgi:hypothetical protein
MESLSYSAVRRGEGTFELDHVLRAVAAASGPLLPGAREAVETREHRVVVVAPRDPDRYVRAYVGSGEGCQTLFVYVSEDLVKGVDPNVLQTFLTRVSQSLDLDVGRTHTDPEWQALLPDEWGGNVRGVGWYQYFGARVTAQLKGARTVQPSAMFRVERHSEGGLVVTLASRPLEEPSWEARTSVAEALGMSLRSDDEWF